MSDLVWVSEEVAERIADGLRRNGFLELDKEVRDAIERGRQGDPRPVVGEKTAEPAPVKTDVDEGKVFVRARRLIRWANGTALIQVWDIKQGEWTTINVGAAQYEEVL